MHRSSSGPPVGSWAEVSVSQSVHPSGDSNCPGADTESGAIGDSIHLHPVMPAPGPGLPAARRVRGTKPRPALLRGRLRWESQGSHGPFRVAEHPPGCPAMPHTPQLVPRLAGIQLYRSPVIPLLIRKFFLSDNLIVQSNHLRDIAHPSSQKRKQRGCFFLRASPDPFLF